MPFIWVSRVRNSIPRACCASVFTATNHIIEREDASHIGNCEGQYFHSLSSPPHPRRRFLTFDVRLHISRWHHLHLIANFADLAVPVVRAPACLHCNPVLRLRCQKAQYLPPRQLLAERDRPVRARAVELKPYFAKSIPMYVDLIHLAPPAGRQTLSPRPGVMAPGGCVHSIDYRQKRSRTRKI